jgi:hypothetical protein
VQQRRLDKASLALLIGDILQRDRDTEDLGHEQNDIAGREGFWPPTSTRPIPSVDVKAAAAHTTRRRLVDFVYFVRNGLL